MQKNRYILVVLLITYFTISIPFTALAFTDTRYHWASPQVDYLASRDLIKGYPDGTFRPDSYITRAEFTALLISFLNKADEATRLAKGEPMFKDLPDTHWAKGYISLARELNIAEGDEKGNFKPYHLINREEAIVMLVKALQAELPEVDKLFYLDEKEISANAKKAIAYATTSGLISGYPNGQFKPNNKLTRAEVTVLLGKSLELQGRKYNFQGTLIDINLPYKEATVRLNSGEEIFKMAENLVVYREDSLERASELDLPANIYFNVNYEGELNYIYITRQLEPSQIKLTFNNLPENSQMVAVDNNIVKLSTIEDFETSSNRHNANIALSLETTKKAMGIPEFVKETGATGRGQLVAIIDSGVDVGHPDLQKTSDNYIKTVDFVDLTDEGKVSLNGPVKAENGILNISGQKVDVSNIDNIAGEFFYGYLGTSFLPKSIKNRLLKDRFLVIVSAGEYYNRFDTVYLDTNMDGQIKDEKPLLKYSRSNQVATIHGEANKAFNLVVAEIAKDNKYVKFGFDSIGHGTEVAGIVAANGQITGVAPGAQILPIKVLNNLGFAYLDKLENAIELAAEMGANIAVMSMGQYQISPAELNKLSNLASRMWNTKGMLLCIAVGNNGPGLGTVANTAAIRNVISVGAYATPEMWQNDYGWEVNEPTLWYFSSSGPGIDGIAAPVVVAPGSVVSTFPMWGNSPYRLDEGTSMAAPHVAGAAALLMDVIVHKMYVKDASLITKGIIAGALPLEGYEAVEQGFGTINLIRTWQEIQKIKDEYIDYKINQYSPYFGYGNGYYSKEIMPAELSVKIFNHTNENRHLIVGGLSSWIKPEQYTVQVPKHGERVITIKYDELTKPGLYSDFLVADNYDTPGWDVAALQTVVVPYDLQKLPKNELETKDRLGAGQFKRYFIKVPAGTENLDISLAVGDKGRARMHIISPQGFQDVSLYAGVGTNTNPGIATNYVKPVAGTWEIVVYSSATISNNNLKESSYTLKASIDKVKKEATTLPEPKYLVTAYPPKKVITGEKNLVILQFFDAFNKKPAEGIVTVNERLYEINKGLVKVEVVPEKGEMQFRIAW